MFPALLLALTAPDLGQCPGGTCPRSSASVRVVVKQTLPLPMPGSAPAAYGGGFFAASGAGPVRTAAGGVAGWVRSHRPHLRRGGCR